MSDHRFGYFLREGLRNMFSHGFMSFAAIGVTVACLVIMGTFTLVAVNANAQLKDLESENEFLAFVDDSLTRSEAEGLKARIEAVPNVPPSALSPGRRQRKPSPASTQTSRCSRTWIRRSSGTAMPSVWRT